VNGPTDNGVIRVQRAGGSVLQQAAQLLESRSGRAADAEVFVAIRSDRIVAAIDLNCHGGVLATCSVPEIFADIRATELSELLGAATNYLDQRQLLLTTVLATEIRPQQRSALEAAGFAFAGKVASYLCHPHRFPATVRSPLKLSSMGNHHAKLADVMGRTCKGTLDVPALLACWSPQQMLSHLTSLSGYRPDLWFVASFEGHDVGALLLESDEHECRLLYLGLIPEYRGRGWGHILLAQAMQLAARQRVGRMVLSVDCNNEPAIRVYEKAGFLPYVRQRLFFRPATTSPGA
jgi:GNAT superfamily N-acetyltransferase